MRLTPSHWMSAVHGLFTGTTAGEGVQPNRALAEIRGAMLHSLSQSSDSSVLAVQRKIAFAHGFQDLWYLRGDVLAAIALVQGETVAKEKMSSINNMFKGHLPPGLVSRPSPLSE